MSSNSIKSITPSALDRYLQLSGWSRDYNFKNKNLMVFDYKSMMRIAVAASDTYDDFYQSVSSVLPTIGEVFDKNTNEIVKEILTVYYDRLEFRLISHISKDGKLPLSYASQCIEGIKDLILYSACAELSANPVCQRASNEANEIARKFNLAQTEAGSFVFNIDIKVADDLNEQAAIQSIQPLSSFEHKVVERIVTAINQIDTVVNENQSITEFAQDAYKTGTTANMCEALLRLRPKGSEIDIDTKARYASALTLKPGVEYKSAISDQHFTVLDEVSKIYRGELPQT